MTFDPLQEIADIVADFDHWRYRGAAADGYQDVSRAERLAMLDRQDLAMENGPLDPAYDHVARFDAAYLANALFADQSARALPLVQLRCPSDAVARGEVLALDWRFVTMAVCVLAVENQTHEALALMHLAFRCGHDQVWRFNLDQNRDERWDIATGERRWLSETAKLPEYQQILRAYLQDWAAHLAIREVPLKLVQDAVLGGSKPKKCDLSAEKIPPGTAIVRFRPLHVGEVNSPQMASAEAFSASTRALARQQLETNTIPNAQMFPPLRLLRDRIKTPEIALWLDDAARAADQIDVTRATDLIAYHTRKPISYVWQGPDRHRTEPPRPFHAEDGHGEAGDLLWKLIRSGHLAEMVTHAQSLPDDVADRFFALLACFDDPGAALAAAGHFGLPDLPDLIGMALSARAKPKTAEVLADYGAAHPRWRRAIAGAMAAYALNLYGSFVPSVNWYFDGWSRFSRAYGASLMFFCTDTPRDIPVLAQMLERREMIRGSGSGSSDGYSTCAPLFYQGALLHLARNDPARLADWIAADWMTKRYGGAAEVAMRRYVMAR